MAAINWPSEAEVDQAINERALQPAREPDFFWEDHSDEPTHPEAVRIRTFRDLALRLTVGAAMRQMEAAKENHFLTRYVRPAGASQLSFVPFVVTAGGGISSKAQELVREAMQGFSEKLRIQSNFKKHLIGQLSIVLAHFNCLMAIRLNKRV